MQNSPLCGRMEIIMEKKIITGDMLIMEVVEEINSTLHEYAKYIIGRMGIPYREKNISIISIAIDAPQDMISALSGKIGKLPGISVKTAYSNVISNE